MEPHEITARIDELVTYVFGPVGKGEEWAVRDALRQAIRESLEMAERLCDRTYHADECRAAIRAAREQG